LRLKSDWSSNVASKSKQIHEHEGAKPQSRKETQ
jgi:hypothetical protein